MAPNEVYQETNNYGFGKSCAAVREAVPIEQIASRYMELRPFVGALRGKCPVHGGDNPTSFSVRPEAGRAHCFSCGFDGDVIDLEFFCGNYGELWEAMIALAVEFNVELPKRPKRWHAWNQTKYSIRDAAEEARKVIRRERLFKLLVLSGPEFEIEDEAERRAAVERAWNVFDRGMKRISL